MSPRTFNRARQNRVGADSVYIALLFCQNSGGWSILTTSYISSNFANQHHLEETYARGTLLVPDLVGTFVFALSGAMAGDGTGSRAAAMNHKGVFTRDRRPKMAAHFLRSRWAGK